jgi:hypothetical protein
MMVVTGSSPEPEMTTSLWVRGTIMFREAPALMGYRQERAMTPLFWATTGMSASAKRAMI